MDRDEIWVSFGSERFETNGFLDYAQFRITRAGSLGDALQTKGNLYADTSALVSLGEGALQRIRVLAATLDEDGRDFHYDAVLSFEFDDGRVISVGHSPGVYEGVCVARGEPVTLGNPRELWDRIVIAR